MERVTIPIHEPLDLRRTLAPLHGRFASDGWWLTARTSEGPASIRVQRTREKLIADGWGAGAPLMLRKLGALCGLDDDPSSFVTDHPIVSKLHRAYPGWRFGRTGLVFDCLVTAVCGQKVTGTEATAAIRGLSRKFGDPAPGPRPGLRLPPDPSRMASAPYWEFHDLHLEKRRADVIRRLAAIHEKIELLAGNTPSEASQRLARLRGVGEWSIAKTLEASHGDPDQVAVGDFHLKHIVVHHLTGRDRGTDEEMLELLEPFRPHRGRVTRLLHTLGHEPKFGPRSKPRDITGI